jgi:arabinan endo-1,5-alpha-L-arabinosidase
MFFADTPEIKGKMFNENQFFGMKITNVIFFVFFFGSVYKVQGQFQQFENTAGIRHSCIVAADIDNDGDMDIIVSGETAENNITVAKSSIYLNDNGSFTGQTTAGSTYKNPVFVPDFADPTVIKAGDGWYYAYGTENTWTDGVHHIVPIIKSKNLTQWQFVADAFKARPSWKNNGGIWAPDVTYVNGKYYMYYSFSTWGDSNPGIGLAISDTPEGPFVDQGKLFDSSFIGVSNSIDPYFMQTGSAGTLQSYLFWGSFNGIYGIELNADLRSFKGSKFKIAGNAFEAPYIKEKNGKYYFFGSVGSCCDGANSLYRVGIAVSDNIKGPYKDKNGVGILADGIEGSLFLAGNVSGGWVGPGHNSKIITDDAGTDYLFYHAVQVSEPFLPGGATRRPLMLDKINWINNWPQIIGSVPGLSEQLIPIIKP